MEHFEVQMIPNGRWWKISGGQTISPTARPKPHLIPITEEGRKFVANNYLSSAWKLAFSMIELTTGAEKIIGIRFDSRKEATAKLDELNRHIQGIIEAR